MSASDKKKLRKEQESAKLTEKQISAEKESKKIRLYTIAFVAVMAVVLVVAICFGINQAISNSGVREKKTVAYTVGSHELSSVEMNYFYMEAVNNFYSQYSNYASLLGLDASTALDQQIYNPETNETWADYFLSAAKENAKAAYALADAAGEAGYTLSEEETAGIDSSVSNLALYATMYGYSDTDSYLRAMYGSGSTQESFRAYMELNTLAQSYYASHADSLTYTDADLRAQEAENYSAYSSYSFNTYYLAASRFREGGTTDEDGNTTYSEEEIAASVAAAEEAAKSLIGEEITSVAQLDAAIAALSVNADTTASSTAYTDTLYSTVSSTYADWVTDSSRKAGDKTYIASTSTSTDEEGNEVTTTNGYFVLYFAGSNDNTFPLANVRHILAAFEGGTSDGNGNTTYSDEEKAAAKSEAEDLLAQWKAGDATEDSFAELANANSDDGDGTTGGLYENVYPGQMVTSFNDWCFDDSRAAGDTGIVESEYGYHVMYYVGDSRTTYRDYQIENELRSADLQSWYTSLVEAATTADGDTRYIRTDLVLNVR